MILNKHDIYKLKIDFNQSKISGYSKDTFISLSIIRFLNYPVKQKCEKSIIKLSTRLSTLGEQTLLFFLLFLQIARLEVFPNLLLNRQHFFVFPLHHSFLAWCGIWKSWSSAQQVKHYTFILNHLARDFHYAQQMPRGIAPLLRLSLYLLSKLV